MVAFQLFEPKERTNGTSRKKEIEQGARYARGYYIDRAVRPGNVHASFPIEIRACTRQARRDSRGP
jgi:hypothetical protein